jgi:hypothetical protein
VASTGLVDVPALSAGLASGLAGSCLVCSVCNMGLVAEPVRCLEWDWLTSAKRRAGSGGLAEDNGLACGVTLDEESWNIDWGLEGCILNVTLVCVCLSSGPKNNYTYMRLQSLTAMIMKITVFKNRKLLNFVQYVSTFQRNLMPKFSGFTPLCEHTSSRFLLNIKYLSTKHTRRQ